MHPRQASLLTQADDLTEKIAGKKPVAIGAPVLWKYVDPDTQQSFYLHDRKMTIKSPWTGKSFTTRPEKMTIPAVGKDMKEVATPPAAAPGGAPGPKQGAPKKKRADWQE